MPKGRRRLATEEKKKPAETGGGNREELLAALTRLKPAVAVSAAIPQQSHVWFDDDRAYAFDGGLGVRVNLDTGFSFGVSGATLLGLLQTSSLKNVELKEDGDALALKMGKSRTKLATMELVPAFWNFPEPEGKSQEITADFIEALRMVLIVQGGSEARIEHQGVFVYRTDTGVELYTTDTKSIARTWLEVDKAKSWPKVALLPMPFAKQLVAQCPSGAKLFLEEDHLCAVGEDVELYSNLLDISGAHDLRKVTTKELNKHGDTDTALPPGLEAVLDRSDVLARGSKEDAALLMQLNGKDLHITGKYATGELKEQLTLEDDGGEVTVGVTAPLLRRALAYADGFSLSKSSVVFYGDTADFFYMVASRD